MTSDFKDIDTQPLEADSRYPYTAVPPAIETRIDDLQTSIERLSQSVGEMKLGLDEMRREKTAASPSRLTGVAENYAEFSRGRVGYSSNGDRYHKDILEDVEDWSGQDSSGDDGRILSPEIQIQRLTAQLTAAYSRIAALEEQLLARRVH